MERVRLAAVLVAIAVIAAVFLVILTWGLITPPTPCPLTFSVRPVNTTFGWIYVVEFLRGTPLPLSAYNVTFFTWDTNATGSEGRVIEYEGPLTAIVGSPGNVSFQDRGGLEGYLDDSGDYFWARTWHNLWVEQGGQVVGGTVGCI